MVFTEENKAFCTWLQAMETYDTSSPAKDGKGQD